MLHLLYLVKFSTTDIESYLRLLAETPVRIAASTTGIDDTILCCALAQKEWSAVDILAHLRGCADLWTHSIYAMLVIDSPVLPLLDPRRWAKVAGYASLNFSASLQVFSLQREELLHVLQALPFEAWERGADIGGRRHTIFSQARRLAKHEGEHCKQIEAITSKKDRSQRHGGVYT